MFVGLLWHLSHFLIVASKPIASRTIPGCKIFSSDRFLDNDLHRYFVNCYFVAATNIKLLAQRPRERDLSTAADPSFFHVLIYTQIIPVLETVSDGYRKSHSAACSTLPSRSLQNRITSLFRTFSAIAVKV